MRLLGGCKRGSSPGRAHQAKHMTTNNSDTQTEINNRDEFIAALEDWLNNAIHAVGPTTEEVLRDVVARPDSYEETIDSMMTHAEHDEMTWDDWSDVASTVNPRDTDYPADEIEDIDQARELQHAGLSRMQSLVAINKARGYTHEEIADRVGIQKPTVDEHSRRIGNKRREAEKLLALTENDTETRGNDIQSDGWYVTNNKHSFDITASIKITGPQSTVGVHHDWSVHSDDDGDELVHKTRYLKDKPGGPREERNMKKLQQVEERHDVSEIPDDAVTEVLTTDIESLYGFLVQLDDE